jgi:hypothetical protein
MYNITYMIIDLKKLILSIAWLICHTMRAHLFSKNI